MFKPIWSFQLRKVVLRNITMAHGLTEEDLDAQFEQFLKESVSDDSTDLGHGDNQQPVFSSRESNQNLNILWGKDDKISSGTTEPALLPVSNVTGMGLDTMEEEEEKTKFFAQLEAGASSTVDYSQLNRQLDSTFNTSGDLGRAEQTAEDHGVTGVVRPFQDSLHHSQYLEDWSDMKEPLEEKPRVSPMLAKGQLFTQSGESDMESLQEAYIQINARESSGDLPEDSCGEGKGHTSQLTFEDMSTAEEFMQPIRPRSTGAVDSTLQPLSKPKQKQSGDRGAAARAMDVSGSAQIPLPPSNCNLESSIIKASQDSSGDQHPLSLELTPPLTSVKSELDANLTNELMPSLLQMDTRSCQEKAQEEDEDLFEGKELKAQLTLQEKELQMMKKEADGLTSLRERNVFLQSKLQSQRKWKEEAAHPQEKPQHVKKEIKEQEMLIKAFQQENEKLYLQLKALQAKSKANEEAMFQANQRLLNELALTHRDQLSKSSWRVGSVLPVNCSGDLLAQIRVLQNNESKLSEELHSLKQEKIALEVDLQQMKKERDLAKAQVVSNKVKPNEEEVTQRKRLQPFAETNAGRLKAASTEILQLKERVKELEQTLRDCARKPTSSRVNALLERRVQRLEAELESQNEEAKQSLHALQQQFHLIKGRHEQQISALEQQLEQKQQVKPEDSGMADCQALEEKLNRIRQYHQEKEKSLLQQVKTLQQQLETKPGPDRHPRHAEAAYGLRIERLNQELATKTRSIQELNRTVKRLQRERRNMSVSEPCITGTKQQYCCHRTHHSAPAEDCSAGVTTFLPAQYEKAYQPAVFTGSHISEVLQENKDLKQSIELLRLHNEEEKAALKADAFQAKEELLRLEEQLTSLKTEHHRVLVHMRTTALEHSSSKVTELTNRLRTRETDLKHLQEQLKELQKSKEALAVSKSREDVLQMQLMKPQNIW
ncbi:Centrosomal protein of 162 kDa [Oryzias melastigma]|uniref:Centrosomal protein of 162 kDa n=1 Tax=Oryzias melastigma TaxID=30732 RepID=A0A834BSF3_ORYME|nr:Centrosomal protein of 162 kDa [Oryzias melastigma]